MTLDLGVLAALALLAVVGFFSGAIRQISHWIGMLLAFVLAKPIGMAIGPFAAAKMGWPPSLTMIGLSAVLLPIIVVVAAVLSRMVLNAIIPGDERNLPDRVVGAILGIAKGGLIVWALLSVVVSFEKPLAQSRIDLAAKTQGSSAMGFARDHNFFASIPLPAIEGVKRIGAARSDPKALMALLNDPSFKRVLSDPKLKSALNDPTVKNALQGGDPAALLQNPQVKKLLEDPDMVRKLADLQAQAKQD